MSKTVVRKNESLMMHYVVSNVKLKTGTLQEVKTRSQALDVKSLKPQGNVRNFKGCKR